MSNLKRRLLEDDHHDQTPKRRTTQWSTGPSMVEAGRDIAIYDGTFSQVNGTYNQVNGPFTQINYDKQKSGTLLRKTPSQLADLLDLSGIHILSKIIATDATHDACERYPAPNVHQGTRTKILEVLTAWINNLDSECPLFWLHGSAGVGKSAILQALAELLFRPKGPIVATFFFGKGQSKRGSGDYLFSTLAYQLALNVPDLRAYVDEVMQNDPTLPTKSMEIQLRSLIIEPFQQLKSLPDHVQTVIIDGLDECRGDATQESIIRLIGDAFNKHKLPLRFLIASRPEPHIRNAFDNPSLLPISNWLMLHNDFETWNDIKKYFQDGFADICRKSRSMVYVEMPWPGLDVLDTLTRHASGQFVYAATVLKFVGQKCTYPPRQLEIVLQCGHPSRGKAFSDLDCLYHQILSTHGPDPVTLKRVLSTILAFQVPQPAIVIEDILEMEKGEVLDILQGLHSLLKVPSDDIPPSLAISYGDDDSDDDGTLKVPSIPPIRIRHASFRDYLLDKSRSGTFYIDETTLNAHLSTAIFIMTSNWIFKSSKTTPNSPSESYTPNPSTQRYIREYLYFHLDNLHNGLALNEVAVQFELQVPNRIEDASRVPFEALYSLIEPLSQSIRPVTERLHWEKELINTLTRKLKAITVEAQDICEELIQVRKKYVAFLDVCYRSVLSSGNLPIVLAKLPGFGVIKWPFTPNILHCIYKLDEQEIDSILREAERFMDFSSYRLWHGENKVRLSPHVFEFLTDKERAGVHYYDPVEAHFMLCHTVVSMLFPPNWQDIPE